MCVAAPPSSPSPFVLRQLAHINIPCIAAAAQDLVAPAEIVGKRIRVRTDGSKLLKVHLSAKDQTAVESKLDAFAAVYKAMCNKDVSFEFPVTKD